MAHTIPRLLCGSGSYFSSHTDAHAKSCRRILCQHPTHSGALNISWTAAMADSAAKRECTTQTMPLSAKIFETLPMRVVRTRPLTGLLFWVSLTVTCFIYGQTP